jgi:hypothetical protein
MDLRRCTPMSRWGITVSVGSGCGRCSGLSGTCRGVIGLRSSGAPCCALRLYKPKTGSIALTESAEESLPGDGGAESPRVATDDEPQPIVGVK